MPLELDGPHVDATITAAVEKTRDDAKASLDYERTWPRWSITASVAWAKRAGASVSAKVKWKTP